MAQDTAEIIDDLIQGNEEDFETTFYENDEEMPIHKEDIEKENLNTHNKINSVLCGTIIEISKGYSKTTLLTTKDMAVDELGLIHSGFIFGAADYAAAVSVNEQNLVIISSRSKYLAPAKLNDIVTFEAKAKFEDARKREIKVIGNINDIKIYEGVFQAVILAQHIFKTKIKNADRSYR